MKLRPVSFSVLLFLPLSAKFLPQNFPVPAKPANIIEKLENIRKKSGKTALGCTAI